MARSFEEVLIERINECDRGVEDHQYRLDRPSISPMEAKFFQDVIDRYKTTEAFLTFISRINDTMQLDIDDATFRKTVGTFFTSMVEEVGEHERFRD